MSNWIDEWESKARAATQGNWTVDRKGYWCGIESSAEPHDWIACSAEEAEEGDLLLRNVDHIAHSNPEFVLAVIEKLRAAEEALQAIALHGCCVMHNDEGCPGCASTKALAELRRAPGGGECRCKHGIHGTDCFECYTSERSEP